MREKFGPNLLFTGKIAFFQKVLFSTTSQVLKEWSYNFHSSCQNTFWTLIVCPLRFFTFDIARKNRPKYFIHWKSWLFLKKFLFSATSYILRKWSYNLHNFCQNTLYLGAVCSMVCLWMVEIIVSVLSSVWNLVKLFSGSNPRIRKVLFLYLIVLQKWSYNMDHKCQNTLWSLTKGYSMSG